MSNRCTFQSFEAINYIKTEADLDAYVAAVIEAHAKRIAELEAFIKICTERELDMTDIDAARALLAKATP